MREVYLLNNGDSLKKISVDIDTQDIKVADTKLFGHNFAITKEGADDLTIVKNYLPVYVYRIKKDDNYLDILARGFKMDGGENISEGDIVVLKKPNSIRYTVSPLETLDDISFKFGIAKNDIMLNNNLNTEKLFVGQILWI